MNLVPLSIDSIHFGQPLPFVLRGADGALLAQKGFIIRNRADLNTLLARGVQLHVDTDESGLGGDDAADTLRYLVASKPKEYVVLVA